MRQKSHWWKWDGPNKELIQGEVLTLVVKIWIWGSMMMDSTFYDFSLVDDISILKNVKKKWMNINFVEME